MAARVIPVSGGLSIHHVEETSAGRVIAVSDDGVLLCFDTAADVQALIDGLLPAKTLLEAREARQMAVAR